MRLRLVVPADVDAPTGGNAYDLALARALRAGGDDVAVVRCLPGRLGATLAGGEGTGRSEGTVTLVDGLLAGHDPQALAGSGAWVLVHLPLALDVPDGTGAARSRAALDEAEGRALRAAAGVVATSRWAADDLRRRHGLRRVAVAPPGVDPAPLEPGSNPPLLVHVAAVVPRKDQLATVTALAAVADLPWRARLAGPDDRDPGYAARVRAAVAAAGLAGRVEVPGALDRDDAWAGADLALLPSRAETFGMVVTEALARGVPAVVSGGGAAEALATGRPGSPGAQGPGAEGPGAPDVLPGAVLPAPGPGPLAEVLREWLTDPRLRSRMRAAARAVRPRLPGWEATAAVLRRSLVAAGPGVR